MVGFFENLRSERAIAARVRTACRCGRFWDTVWKRGLLITAA
jgi:hypothetical protein